ncbi:MAG: metallophosphatase [Cytophagales bacterium]|nr:metallophosphatase [Armatimonadota bacterium]
MQTVTAAADTADVPRSALAPALHILHTNDFHNSLGEAGGKRLREAIASLEGAPYLFLDAGDAIKAGNVGVNPFGEPILDCMSDLGYDAMTLGNREFHILRPALETKISHARFPILCANLRGRDPEAAQKLPVVPHITLDRGGLKVTIFGLTVPMVTEKMKMAAAVSAFLFDDPIEVARRLVAELRWGADVLIALTHIGIREDERLARSVSGIDLIIGGHSHVSLASPQWVEREGGSSRATPIVQAGWHARSYGHVTLHRPPGDRTGEGAWQVHGELHPLQERVQERGKPH